MGAQRFATSSGLPVDMSDEYRSAVGSLNWVTGGQTTGGNSCDGPQVPLSNGSAVVNSTVPADDITHADGGQGRARPCGSLTQAFTICAIVLGSLAGLQLLTYLMWKYVVNRRWYADRRDKFIPYPAFLVFPGLLIVGVAVFLTGLLGAAIQVLLATKPEEQAGATCGDRVGVSCACLVLAWVAIGVASCYFAFASFIIVKFNRQYRIRAWEPTRVATQSALVKDPLFRAISKLRTKLCCRHVCVGDGKAAIVERMHGEFIRPPAETVEPERTERLLAKPVALVRGNASDMIDAYSIPLMARASGVSASVTVFEVVILGAQVSIAILNGIGAGAELAPDSTAAKCVVMTIFFVQAGTAVWLHRRSASNDRVVTTVVSLQFALEAAQTALLFVFTFSKDLALERASFYCAFIALLLPIIEQLYDCTAIHIDRCFKGEFSGKAACYALIGLLVAVPR